MRQERGAISGPLAVTEEVSNTQVITSLNSAAESEGLSVGQSLRDARALCAHLVTRERNIAAEQAFLTALRRWAGQFSPWVAPEGSDALVIDLTGCAHLFGGEAALVKHISAEGDAMGVNLRVGLADTRGAAWALARCAGEAAQAGEAGCIAAPGQTYGRLSPLPIAALRLEPDMVIQLNRLGLRSVGDLLGQPRAALARRFGSGVLLRLDQAMGHVPEPVSPARAPDHFAVRMTLPDPIGLKEDLLAALDRMLPRLCARLDARGKGARILRLDVFRTDQAAEGVEIILARPSRSPDRIRPLLEMKVEEIDAGFGIDALRLDVLQAEALQEHSLAAQIGTRVAAQTLDQRLDDLVGRLGARIGMEALTRYHRVETHIPEKTAECHAAAWSEAVSGWPMPARPRPLTLWTPEVVMAADIPEVSARFRWRGRDWQPVHCEGPERIAPEWWLDDPNWRSGVRDYWVVMTACGKRLWLYFAHGGTASRGWFCQGAFA